MREREPKIISTESIRENAKLILAQSSDILTLDYTAIREVLAPRLAAFQKEPPYIPAPEKPMTLERELGVTLFMDVVNFCFMDPANGHEYAFEKDGKVTKRSSGLFRAMKEADIDWNNLIEVAALSPEKWKSITQLSDTNTMYLGEERGLRIRGFAKLLLDQGFKDVDDFIESMGLPAEAMLSKLAESGYFSDEFLKRAQLTVRMLDDVYKARGLKGFEHTEILTAMADYRLPQVFYNFGAVKLSENLLNHLNSQNPIESDSREERALRATVIVVGEELSKIMGITEGDIDTLLWTLSQKMARANELPIPHMLVATDKY